MDSNYGRALVFQATKQARYYPGEPVDLTLPDGVEALIATSAQVSELARACKEVLSQIDNALIDELGDQGIARFGPTFYRVQAPSKWKLKDSARTRFFSWVKAHDLAPKLFNPNVARKKALSEMHQLPDPETGEVLTKGEFIDQFLDIEVFEQLRLEKIPESKMAQWMTRVPDGTVRKGGPVAREQEAELPDDDDDDNDPTS